MAIDWDTAILGPCEAVFGEAAPATYLPKAGGSFALAGIFDQSHRDVALLDPMSPASTQAPVFGCRAVNFPSPPVAGDRITMASTGVTYVVREVQPDGHGYLKLLLNKSGRQ